MDYSEVSIWLTCSLICSEKARQDIGNNANNANSANVLLRYYENAVSDERPLFSFIFFNICSLFPPFLLFVEDSVIYFHVKLT